MKLVKYGDKTEDPPGKMVSCSSGLLSWEASEVQYQWLVEALRESEKRYQHLFEQLPVGVVISSPSGRVISANESMQAITGYSVDELKSINLAETYENPEDRELLLEALARCSRVFNYPARLKRKDGTLYDARLNISRLRLDGAGVFQTVIIDVTNRQEKAENQRLTSPESSAGLSTQLQKRFARSGLGDFNRRETIELLMTFYPCGEHNHLIDRACEVFTNVGELLSASPQKLQQLGFPAGCISYIKLMHEIPAQVLREKIIERPIYQSSREIFDYLYYSMRDLKEEVFKVLFLDKGDRVIDIADLFKGTPDGITIHPREVVDNAIKHSASALIFVHNHPSGDPTPSRRDKHLTRDLVFVGNVLQIRVLDHIIIGDNRYFSFADEKLIQKYEDAFLNIRIRHV